MVMKTRLPNKFVKKWLQKIDDKFMFGICITKLTRNELLASFAMLMENPLPKPKKHNRPLTYSGDDLPTCGICGCSEEDKDHD